jgi:hypothetical protein
MAKEFSVEPLLRGSTCKHGTNDRRIQCTADAVEPTMWVDTFAGAILLLLGVGMSADPLACERYSISQR